MPDTDHENKTEQPTEKRLKEARERGQFARSPDVAVAVGLLISGTLVAKTLPGAARQVAEISAAVFTHLGEVQLRLEAAPALTKLAVTTMTGLLTPVLVACTAGGVIANGLQSGFRFTPELLTLKPERLNPAAGLKRIFSAQGLIRLGLDALKLLVVGFVLHGAIQQILGDPVFFTPTDLNHLAEFLTGVSASILRRAALGIGLIAVVHYVTQRRKITNELMMTKQEVKEENQAAEGDPRVKSQRRAMARRLLQKQMLAAVATADVIVTNPTHFAVALRYDRQRDRAPMVLAKGRNRLAQRIRALGAEHDVPTVENVAVARALYKLVPVGQPISSQLYQSVASILTFVYKTHRYYFHRLKARRAAEESAAR